MTSDPDTELLHRYADERDEAAFAELVRRHLALVYSAALRQLDGATHRAEEVTQSVFTDLARKAATLARRDDLAGWLYTSTHFAAAKLKRTEQRRQWREQEAHAMNEILTASSSGDDWERLRPVLDDAMHELAERDREVILQRFFQGCRFAEVGEKLGLSEDAARMRVERALDKLRALLAKRDITSTTAALALALANQPAVALPASLAASVTSSALTAASATMAPAVSIFQIMSTSKIAAGLAGLVLVLTLGVATREFSHRRTAEAALAAANQDYDARVAKLRELERRAQIAERDAAQLKKTADEARAARLATETQAAKAPAWDSLKEGDAFLAHHPEVKQALVARSVAIMRFRYKPLYKSLGLTPAQIDQFEALQSEGAIVGFPVGINTGRMLALTSGTGLPPEEVPGRMRELLGDEGYQKYLEFRRATPARDQAVKVASDLSFTEAPLTTEQSTQLTQILAASRIEEHGTVRAGRFDQQAVMAKAQSALSAPQLMVLDGVLAKQQLQQTITDTIDRKSPGK